VLNNSFFPKILAVYEIKWKNIAGRDGLRSHVVHAGKLRLQTHTHNMF